MMHSMNSKHFKSEFLNGFECKRMDNRICDSWFKFGDNSNIFLEISQIRLSHFFSLIIIRFLPSLPYTHNESYDAK